MSNTITTLLASAAREKAKFTDKEVEIAFHKLLDSLGEDLQEIEFEPSSGTLEGENKTAELYELLDELLNSEDDEDEDSVDVEVDEDEDDDIWEEDDVEEEWDEDEDDDNV